MIPSRQEIAYRVYGAWRLARFDARGVQYFDESPQAALRSFFAAVLVAPAFLVTLLLVTNEPCAADPLAIGLVITLGYSLLWTLFPVIVYRICQVIDREQAFFRYLCADNWASIIGYHFQLAVLLLIVGGVVPAALAPLVELVMHAYLLAYSWFIVRSCLNVTGVAAAAFVALQFAVALFIQIVARSIIYPELP
jgi:hypothetical protein